MERVLDVAAIAQAMPHRRTVRAQELRRDARAETQLGQLLLNGEIYETLYDTGVHLRDVVRRWRVVCGVPRHDRGATPLDGSGHGSGGDCDVEHRRRLTRAYLDAWQLLCDSVGPGGAMLVMRLCVFDEPAIEGITDVYRKALKALAKFWAYR